MSKVTGKDLERLIEGALSERTNIDIKGATLPDLRKKLGLPSDSKITKKKIQSVAGLRNPPHAFKYDDMAAAYFQGQKSPSFDPYETSIDVAGTTDDETIKSDWETLTTTDPEDPAKMGGIGDIDIDAQTYKSDSIAFQQMASIGMQASAGDSAIMGKMPEGLAASTKVFFADKNTFKERLDAISKFSTMVFDDKKFTNMSVEQILAASLFGDYLNTIVKEMDSGSGAYQFEVLLATMAGGTVVGKGDVNDSGNIEAGTMGAVDFVMNDGTYGSAKYYANLGTTSITQSVKGFKNKLGKSTLYVVAHKVGDSTKSRSNRGESDPTKITELHIYLISVVTVHENPTVGQHFAIATNGVAGAAEAGSVKSGQLQVTKYIGNTEPIVIKISPNNQTLKNALETATKNSGEEIKNAFGAFKELFSNLSKANQKMQRYSSTGETDAGEAALQGLDNADEQMVSLIQQLSGKKISGQKKQRKVTEEQKITKEHILKLIEESFNK